MARVELNSLSSGDSAVLYTIKYMLKGQPTRACEGDYLLAALSHLEPENAVTTGVFTKIYNKVSAKRPVPSFEVAHGNLRLPSVLTNFITKMCSVLGIQKILTKVQDSDGVETEEQGYVNPSLIKRFDGTT